MPVSGPPPKPRSQIRHRVKPVHEWAEVVDVPFEGAPALPRSPGRKPLPEPPEPSRPLGEPGLAVWGRAWRDSYVAPDVDALQLLCEQMDERVSLRVRVLKGADWHDRQGLRLLDQQVAAGLRALGLNAANSHPAAWPQATRRWWRALGRMPHCVLWAEPEWQFALDTAVLVAAFHSGDLRLAQEIRTREKLMGTTPDARRGLRIRYIDAESGEESATGAASVTAMDDYRRMVAE